jgi:very-short-patch-repair endonuclease
MEIDEFILLAKANKLPIPEKEYRFCPERRWRFDYAYPDVKIAIEQEGGAYSGGRHTRGSGFIKDMEKYNKAVMLGWRVLRYTPDQMLDEAIIDLKELFCG